MSDKPERRSNASGRPIRRENYVRLPVLRIPRDEPLTPRLQKRGQLTSAIGFHAQLTREYDDED